jgi:hypothetical protein
MHTAAMFAPMAFRKVIPKSTQTWEAERFANVRLDESEEDTTEDEEFDEELGDDASMHASFYTAVPEYGGDYAYDFDPRYRKLGRSSEFGIGAAPSPVLNTIVNPVENLSNRIPMPTVLSPVDRADVGHAAPPQHGGGAEGMDPQAEDATCCGPYIPHFELRQTRENLGLNQAQRARYGTSPGEGVSLQPDEERISGTQQQHGPVDVSDPLYTHELYNQGFVSMSAVPSVFVGVYTDPITGEEYDAYESAMPPPDADYEETLNSSGRNVKLAHLQGGWRDTTPRPTKTEVLEDDFHMQYDRSINTYGTYDPSRYLEIIEHNNRFKHDDHHPDSDGPVIVGLPANTLGNQGDVKIRPMPYLPPTNRGKWAETTFRANVDPSQEGAGGGDQRLEYEWTNTPYARAENSRQDGGGMQAVADYQGFAQQYGGAEGWDNIDTQRSLSQMYTPNIGPAETAVSNMQVFGDVPAPNASTGTIDSGMYAVGNITGEQDAATLQNQLVAAPSSLAGLDVVDESQFGPAQYAHDAHKLMNSRVDNSTVKTGLLANQGTSMGTEGGYHGQQLDKLVHGAQYKTKREALQHIQSAFNTAIGGSTAQPTQATRTRFNNKRSHLTDFMMPGGTIGGTDSMITNGAQNLGAVTNLSTKREGTYDNQFGVKSQQPNDSTVWFGDYRQSMQRTSVRPTGNFTHNAATSGMSIGLRDDSESLAR